LNNLKHVLNSPLAILFTLIFNYGTIPDDWKRAYVTPIFKKGCSADVNNYRPISIISVVCKLFEAIIKQQLVSFLYSHSILSPSQHGFIEGHSTTTNLLESLNDWTGCIEYNKTVKILYTDLL